MYKYILIIIIILFLFYIVNNNIKNIKENFIVTTWTPYIVDYWNQPGYTNYFYNNGYMYPIY